MCKFFISHFQCVSKAKHKPPHGKYATARSLSHTRAINSRRCFSGEGKSNIQLYIWKLDCAHDRYSLGTVDAVCQRQKVQR